MRPAPLRIRAMPALLALLGHGALALMVLRLHPQGFPLGQLHFWSNTAIPVLLAASCLTGLVAFRRPWLSSALVWGYAGMWGAGGVAARVLFPASLPNAWLGGLGVALLLGSAAHLAWRHPWSRVLGLAAPGAALGVTLSLAQRAPEPSTRPDSRELPTLAGDGALQPDWSSPDGRVRVSLAQARVQLECGGLRLSLRPLLRFISRSPDRAWSNLAPAGANDIRRTLTGVEVAERHVRASYTDDGASMLEVRQTPEAVEIEGLSRLQRAVYSHLNTYLGLEIEGRPGLALAFSPMPHQPTEILPSEYPVGLPARAAYLTSDGVLRAVEASSGEKGPFRLLGEGQLSGPLALTLLDERGPACRLELLDWARQASTALSPTAGWGLPQNAIEFHRVGPEPSAPAWVMVTLAATSLGRGWDSVGHAPGLYQNRLRVHPLRP